MWWQSSKNIRDQRSVPPVHFNEIISIGKIGEIVKKEILATTSISSFLGREMIKISEFGSDFGLYGLNA